MSIKERVTQELNHLNNKQLEQVAQFLAFLKFQTRLKPQPILDESQIASLYAEFAEEDRELAEEGLSDYLTDLNKEDSK